VVFSVFNILKMKLIVSLIVIAAISAAVYFSQRKQKSLATKITITSVVALFLFILLGFFIYRDSTVKDSQCTSAHPAVSSPPAQLKSAVDYFIQGNYDYEIGDCQKAVLDYTASIRLNPTSPQSYNNRAYTYMRLRDYKNALSDLDQALALKPNYINALMNRGDIHNYYYEINKNSAIIDYKKVISLGGAKETSVCGHLLLAAHNGWNLGTILDLPAALTLCR
jgi:tetratricopeptide (TPR) repeat protein